MLGRRVPAAALALAAYEQLLRELDAQSRQRPVPPYDFAVIHAGLGDTDRALSLLAKSLDASDPESMILPVDPRLDGLRADVRFAGLLRRMGLPSK